MTKGNTIAVQVQDDGLCVRMMVCALGFRLCKSNKSSLSC